MKIINQQNYNSYYFKICIAVTSLTALVVGILSLSNLDALESVGTIGGGSAIGLGVVGLSICIYFSKKNNIQTNSQNVIAYLDNLDQQVQIQIGVTSSVREIFELLDDRESACVFISNQCNYCFKNGNRLELHRERVSKSVTYELRYPQGATRLWGVQI